MTDDHRSLRRLRGLLNPLLRYAGRRFESSRCEAGLPSWASLRFAAGSQWNRKIHRMAYDGPPFFRMRRQTLALPSALAYRQRSSSAVIFLQYSLYLALPADEHMHRSYASFTHGPLVSQSAPLDPAAPTQSVSGSHHCLRITFRGDSPLAPYRIRLSSEHGDSARPSVGLVLEAGRRGPRCRQRPRRARMPAVCALVVMSQTPPRDVSHSALHSASLTTASSPSARPSSYTAI
ncbi:hypothetical protein C8F01DRAFT_206887 [Mycena amicta]|nr:hypothetical protein C8F01DRAFT_206887 [Mycena amicta]